MIKSYSTKNRFIYAMILKEKKNDTIRYEICFELIIINTIYV